MVLRLFLSLLIVFFLGLGIDYIFVVLEKKGYIQAGSFLHILANGILVFIPLSIVKNKNFYICFPVLLLSSFIVFAPIVIIKYNYVVILSIAVYFFFATYIACKKIKEVGGK